MAHPGSAASLTMGRFTRSAAQATDGPERPCTCSKPVLRARTPLIASFSTARAICTAPLMVREVTMRAGYLSWSVPGSGWVEHVLASFGAPGTCVGYTLSGLIMDAAGNLYGGTTGDGTTACVFELSPSPDGWQFSVLHTFTITNRGYGPVGNMVMGSDGTLVRYDPGSGCERTGQYLQAKPVRKRLDLYQPSRLQQPRRRCVSQR